MAGRLVRMLQPRPRLRPGQPEPTWDATGGADHGPYPHLDELWIEPHHERYVDREDDDGGRSDPHRRR